MPVYPIDVPAAPFPRLCQASIMMGKVLNDRYGEKISSEAARFSYASQLYQEISILSRSMLEEALTSADYLTLAGPLALNFTALCALCVTYTCPSLSGESNKLSTETAAMQAQAVDGLKTVSKSISELVDRVNKATPLPQDIGRVCPVIMGAMYKAAASYAWMIRENGDESSQAALESIRHCLRRLGSRWRNAAEYLRLLEAQEFTYAVGSAGC